MPEEKGQTPPETTEIKKPDWLNTVSPQAELIQIWNDAFDPNCDAENLVKRLREALSKVKGGPPAGLSK